MFVFEFEGALFKFSAKTPAPAPLFQLPPRMNADGQNTLFPTPDPSASLYRHKPVPIFFMKKGP
jgi:hypothetical protein